ncbi:MAG: hypothetical protein JWL69_2844 [Phycisphaerales bacterium]|jgi:hypothetical protein|nr:hypothetical protein [Phycisphaerales bacterium]
MIDKRWVLSAVVAGLAIVGCDQGDQSAKSVPATQPSQTPQVASSDDPATATAPKADPTTKPALPEISTLAVKETGSPDDPGILYEFPRARLHINREDKTATLYTDDPKTAINPSYSGNSYYLVIPLEGDDSQLDGYQWHFRAVGSTHLDSTDGIFRNGQRYHYQPTDITVAFKGSGPTISVAVVGEFSKFDLQQSSEVSVPVMVRGIVSATVDSGK